MSERCRPCPAHARVAANALLVVLAALSLALVSACRASPTTPGTPSPGTPQAPTIACPADVMAETDGTQPARVTYPDPEVSGMAPLSTACSVPSGSDFPVGTTTVVCTATDALNRGTYCAFRVSVVAAPRLRGVTFLAFGDSITSGEVSDPVSALRYSLQPEAAYPTLLEAMLRDRYGRQTPVVINNGREGETVVCLSMSGDCAEDRLVDGIRVHGADALLLLEGINDLNQGVPPDLVSDALRSAVARAFSEGVVAVFVSTILPEVPGRPKAFAEPGSIEAANALIRAWAPSEGAVLVDGFAAIDPSKEQLIGGDGLHPTPEGNRVLAEAFLAAIRDNFEESASEGTAMGVRSADSR